ncbi:hypothetical protein JKF63_02237 [Porcisia hertigi]|uniref:Protein kinase domain-containing protein n=1 Tax=Porcisia hertigi TaxID=2761500 RepID=A0A836HZ43_9TRYP|nr:hypothetical protein JKF63_02237 [Porcisia hertigi]
MYLLAGRYILVKQIGKGGFGAVEEYTDSITKENVAIKTIPSRFVNQESHRLVREIDIMCFLHEAHPHVIGYFSIFVTKGVAAPNHHNSKSSEDPLKSVAQTAENTEFELNVLGKHYEGLSDDERLRRHHEELMAFVGKLTKTDDFNVHIVMPLMKGDLFYFIRLLSSQSSVQRLGVTHQFLAQVAVVFAFQICFGLDYLHQCAIIHRDMKPDNVLVCLNVTNPYMSTALIADMGLARDAQHSDTIYICTRYYRPPEIITSVSGGSTRIDIWSLGCIFYEMCTGQTLFTMRTALNERGEWDGAKASLQLEVILNTIGTPAAQDIHRYMPSGNAKLYLQRSATRPSQLRQLIEHNWILHTSGDEKEKWIDLITRCLAFFPEQRPTAQELCQHQLFRDYNVFYGSNVKQYAPTPYTASFQSSSGSSRSENKASILALVQHALRDTMPPMNEECSDEESTSVSSSNTDRGEGSDSDSDDAPDRVRPLAPIDNRVSASDHFSTSFRSDSRRRNYRSDQNEELRLTGESSSVSDSIAGGSAPPSPPQPLQHQPYALPPFDNGPSKYYSNSFLDDDDDDDDDGSGLERSREPLRDTEDEECFLGFQQQQSSAFMSRFSPGNVFRNSSALLPTRSAEATLSDAAAATVRVEPKRGFRQSPSSEESRPVFEDTPPLAPSDTFCDRIKHRRLSADDEEAQLKPGSQRSSASNMNNYRVDKVHNSTMNEGICSPEGTAPQVMELVSARADARPQGVYNTLEEGHYRTSQAQEPLVMSSVMTSDSSEHTSQFGIGGCAGAAMPPPPPPFYTTPSSKEVFHVSSMRRPSDSSGPHRSTEGQVSTDEAMPLVTSALPGGGTPLAMGSREQYDYFAGTEYYAGSTLSNVAQVAAARQPAEKRGGSPYSSFDRLSSSPLEQAPPRTASPPPLRSVHLPGATSSERIAYHGPLSTVSESHNNQLLLPQHFSHQHSVADFPAIENAELRQRYMLYPHTPQSIQAATSAVLEELGGCTHDAERSSDLRELLNYYTSLQVKPMYAA